MYAFRRRDLHLRPADHLACGVGTYVISDITLHILQFPAPFHPVRDTLRPRRNSVAVSVVGSFGNSQFLSASPASLSARLRLSHFSSLTKLPPVLLSSTDLLEDHTPPPQPPIIHHYGCPQVLHHPTMLTAVFISLMAVPGSFFIWSALSIQANRKKAKMTGLPILVRWITPINPFWLLCGSSIVLKCRAWGIGTNHFHRFYTFGWEANERHIVHEELGPAFMLVSPGGNWLCVSDASVFADVIHRRTDFRRNMEQFELLNVYGKNLATTDDEEWQKHRKITAITFTERNNELVWKQSVLQAQGMIEHWLKHQHINTTAEDTKIFTLNVLAAAIFNKSYSYHGAADAKADEKDDDDSYLYRDSLGRILGNVIPILICGEQGLKAWWTPKSWKEVSNSIATFRSYVTGLINEERVNIERGVQNNQHLVAAVVRACEKEKREVSGGKRIATLTEEEIVSNMFVYAFAGNDTTAIVLHHLLVNLAAYPEFQDWVAEEIQYYLPDNDTTSWAYKTFPKLKRCQAVIVSFT